MRQILRHAGIALVTLLAGCATPVTPAGSPAPTPQGVSTYVLATPRAEQSPIFAEVTAAVTTALAGKSYRESSVGRFRLELGFSSRPVPLEVVREDGRGRSGRKPLRRPVLCQPELHVLSIGMIDQADGAVIFRSTATARHCGALTQQLIDRLAQVAVNGRERRGPPADRG